MKILVIHSGRHPLALAERLKLLETTNLVLDVSSGSEAAHILPRDRSVIPYVIDINSHTVRLMAALWRTGRSWVLDIGDDPSTLRKNMGGGRSSVAALSLVTRLAVCGAVGVVCRGHFHVPLLAKLARGPIHFAPDTVSDDLLDRVTSKGNDKLIGTFGSTPSLRSGDRVYGWEVIDAVASAGGSVAGLVVANGPGITALQARARRMGVSSAVEILPARPLDELVTTLSAVGFITSVQSNDLAGWIRTTAKLPLSLALGKYVIASAVGEALVALPPEALMQPLPDRLMVKELCNIVARGTPTGWTSEAKRRAEPFRRSRVAADLSTFLTSLDC